MKRVSPQIMQEVLSFHGSLVELTFGLMVIWQNIIQEERLHRLHEFHLFL